MILAKKMARIKIVTETILEINPSSGDRKDIERASNWSKKVSDFLNLVRNTLVQDVDFVNQRITSIQIDKDQKE